MTRTLDRPFTLTIRIKSDLYVFRLPGGTSVADVRPALEQWLREQVESGQSRVGASDAMGGLQMFDEAMAWAAQRGDVT
ncbi:MAG: hypothetical protein GY778_13470 [bacterium]|nr:hypothetical protein [bacterium]